MNATAELDWIGTPKKFEDVVERVAAAQAQGMDVGLDFHGRVHRPMAKQLAKALDPLGLLFIEEPLLSENPEGLKQIAELVSTPIALGERLFSRWDFKPFFEMGAVDIIQPDLSHAGGILEVRKIAAMAEAYDIAVAPHCPLGPLALAACLQVAACTPNHAIQEISLGIHYNTGGHDLLNFCTDKAVLTPVDGYLAVPEGAGLGVDIDEAAVREAHKDRHRWRNPVWRTEDGSFAEW
jgi:galactonate dehydratase